MLRTSLLPLHSGNASFTASYEIITDMTTKDPWANRSAGMRCVSCLWFAPKYPDEPPTIDDRSITLPAVAVGRCRRHAPTMNGFPVVKISDWCGDHRLDENKL